MNSRCRTIFCLLFASFLLTGVGWGQVTPPEEFLGFKPGADFKLMTYEQAIGYLERLAEQTPRIQIFDMGPTAYGRRMKYAVISSDENMADLDRYKEINRKLSLARGVSPAEAETLSEEGKAVVWIDGGLHEGEVSGAQQLSQLAYDIVTGDDRRTRLIRDNVIFVLVYANPDGMTIVSDWYMKNVGTEYEVSPVPSIHTKLRGTNRDSFISNLLETRNLNRATSREWYPEILYNAHQTAPFPARIWIPPEAEQTNYNVHPILIREKNLIGSAMGQALEEADQPGAISRIGFDSWWTGYHLQFNDGHNTPSILTETAMYPYATPHFYQLSDFPEAYQDLTVGVFYPSPWKGGWWRLQDAVAYNITVSKSILELAAKYRYNFLHNKWKMATNIIDRFENEAPYGWIFSADQRDANTTALLLNKLILYGLEVYRASSAFVHEGVSYPEGSFIVPTSQPFGLYAKSLLEIQHSPDLRKYSHLWQGSVGLVDYEGPPLREYDGAGWTLPIQMGIDSRVMSTPLDQSIDITLIEEALSPPGTISGNGAQIVFSHSDNHSFKAVNLIQEAGGKVNWALDEISAGQTRYSKGAFVVDGRGINAGTLEKISAETRVPMSRSAVRASSTTLLKPRIAVYNGWVGGRSASWVNWLFEEYGFPHHILRDGEVKAGNLHERFDVIVLPDQGAESILNGFRSGEIHPDYVGGIGQQGLENLKAFVEEGGTLVCNQSSTDLAIDSFYLPVKNILEDLEADEFFCPGSIIKMDYDTGHPLAFGMQERGIAYLKGSRRGMPRVFEILEKETEADKAKAAEEKEETEEKEPTPEERKKITDEKVKRENKRGLTPIVVSRFPDEDLLISGKLIGGDKIRGKPSILDVPVGKGRVVLFGFNVVNRAQTHSTFRLLFNATYYRTTTTEE